MYILDKKLLGPIVYLIRENDILLYIGSSVNGVCRLYNHNILTTNKIDFDKLDIEIVFCETYEDAKDLEVLLIKGMHPLLNKNNIDEDIKSYYKLLGKMKGQGKV